MDNVNTHKNEAQEKTPRKINFVQRFFRKLIGYQEPKSYQKEFANFQKTMQLQNAKFEDKMEMKYASFEPEIDYVELAYEVCHASVADYVDHYTLAGEMDHSSIAEYIDVDYHQIIENLDYESLSSYILDEDLKTGIESLEKELLTIQNNFDGFYQSLSKILKERNI